jgi:hypothetical protein
MYASDVQMAILDECSMISQKMLSDINMTLTSVNAADHGTGKPFGNVDMAFFGDFYQLPCVGGKALYSTMNRENQPMFIHSGLVASCALWDQRTDVFVLDEVMRQDDPAFVDLLRKVREHKVDDAAYAMLESRLVGSVDVPDLGGRFANAPMLTRRHDFRRVINEKKARVGAGVHGETLFRWACSYTAEHHAPVLSQENLQNKISFKLITLNHSVNSL